MAKKHSNINTTQLLDSENNHIYPIVYWEDVLIFENGTEEYKRFLNDAAKRSAVTSTIMTNIDGTQGEDVRAHIDDWIPTYGGLLKYIEKKSPVFYRNVLDLSYDDAKKSDKEKDLPTLKTLTSLEQTLTKKIDEIDNNTINKLGSASLLNVTDHTTIVADIKTTKQDKNVIDVQSLKKLNADNYFGSKEGTEALNYIKSAYTYDFRTGDKYQDCKLEGSSLKIPIIVGADGGDGKPGIDGKDAYVYIKWSANSNGSGMVDKPTGSTHYLGVCSTHSSSAPTSPTSYNWKYVKGDTGPKGDKGNDGKDGTGVNILGTVSSVSQLPTIGTNGDAYLIDGVLYVYVGSGGDTAGGKWQNAGNIKGPKGEPGKNGVSPSLNVSWNDSKDIVTINGQSSGSLKGQKGEPGKNGNNFNPDTHIPTIINKLTGKFVKINSTASENKGTVKVEGEIWSSSGFYEESDKRLKENIVEVDGAISKLKQIPAVNFNFKNKDGKELGTIAQDVQKVFPELVTTNEDGYLAVEYNKLSMVAIAAVKEMDERLSSLEKTVEELLKKIK